MLLRREPRRDGEVMPESFSFSIVDREPRESQLVDCFFDLGIFRRTGYQSGGDGLARLNGFPARFEFEDQDIEVFRIGSAIAMLIGG